MGYMKKIPPYVFPILALIVGAILIVKSVEHTSISSSNNKILVTTSFYPLYFFTKEITGDLANVVNITPSGVEPHDYEPSTSDIATIEKSNLLILNGGGLEPWGGSVKANLSNSQTKVVTTSDGLQNGSDPHIWLDPVLAKEEVSEITKGLNEVSPGNITLFGNNADGLERKLIELDGDFANGLKNCKQKNIVTSHSAFGYLAARYGFTQMSVSGLSPDEEPSAKKMSEIATFVKQNNIHYIFFEELVSPKLSETLAKETGAKTLVFNPLEGLTRDEEERGEDYFSIQRKNLENLKIALECN